jgi:hypothetical protein
MLRPFKLDSIGRRSESQGEEGYRCENAQVNSRQLNSQQHSYSPLSAFAPVALVPF